jgi:hypothetical protein
VVISRYAHIRAALSDHLSLSAFFHPRPSPLYQAPSLIIHPSTILIIIQVAKTTLFSSPVAVNPYRHPAASGVQGCIMSRTATKGRWNTLYNSFRPNGRIFHSSTFRFIPQFWEVPPHPLFMFVTFEMTFRDLFYYLSPCFLAHPHSMRIRFAFSQVGVVFTHRPLRT